ncbi:MAG: 2Fe-2S iron-sulfur cluster binding domain-containing protein [Acidobacteria bacterium]|jgi:ferredoxin|nr:2Fe-2S iron-sulfur cluster binding domain-containing protein [Acidobacteriota bacterium]
MNTTKFEEYLNKFDEADWLKSLNELLPAIGEVDRTATQIWFRFFPLALHNYLQSTEDKEKAIQQFVMQGNYELKNQIDSSHRFLYGHRFWKEAKDAIEKYAESFTSENANLANEIKEIAKTAAQITKTDASLLIGITAIGLMTLRQVGFDAFKNAAGKIYIDKQHAKKSAKEVLAERAKDDSQGILGFLKTTDKKWTVVYDENTNEARFKLFDEEELASGSARDQSKNWKALDERCWEGVIPVECRSASCGTCWIGVLGGAEKLSDVARLERKQMKVFGYNQGDAPKPFIRLACQAKAHGAVSIVIPPWNGVFGKKIYGNVEKVELEPATTSAVKLREAITNAVGNK